MIAPFEEWARQMSDIDYERLRKAVERAANVFNTHGEKYWPVFERLERELEHRKSRRKRIEQYATKPFQAAESKNAEPPQDTDGQT